MLGKHKLLRGVRTKVFYKDIFSKAGLTRCHHILGFSPHSSNKATHRKIPSMCDLDRGLKQFIFKTQLLFNGPIKKEACMGSLGFIPST